MKIFAIVLGILLLSGSRINPAIVSAPREESWWKDRHQDLLRQDHKNAKLLFIGDSITQGWLGEGTSIWTTRFGKYHPANLGINADQTQQVLWRIENGELAGLKPHLAVVMIGTNNLTACDACTDEDIVGGIKEVVLRLQEKLPNTKVLLLGVFPRGELKSDSLRRRVTAVNKLLSNVQFKMNVTYRDIGSVFLESDGRLLKPVSPDGVHLSALGYTRWADAIQNDISARIAP